MNYKLICFDMDGVLFKDINFWMELHKAFGTEEEGKLLTEKYLHTNYEKLVEEVVMKLWSGRDAQPYYDLVKRVEYNPGAHELFSYIESKKLITAIISASAKDVALRVQKDYDVPYIYANELVVEHGVITGEFNWPIGAGKETKALIIEELSSKLGIAREEVIYVGDSDTDIAAAEKAGYSIAFNSHSEGLKAVADKIIDSHDLRDLLAVFQKIFG